LDTKKKPEAKNLGTLSLSVEKIRELAIHLIFLSFQLSWFSMYLRLEFHITAYNFFGRGKKSNIQFAVICRHSNTVKTLADKS
jgi:hypothetical protein